MLNRDEKSAIISNVKELIEKSQALFLTNLIGIESNQAVAIRKKVRDAEGHLLVTKNTFFRLGAKGTYAEQFLSELTGTNAIAFAFKDAPSVAKVIFEANKESEIVKIENGMFEGKAISKQEVLTLALLPSRDQMLGTLLATFNAPVSAFARVIEAIRAQKEESGDTVVAN